jgi:hypothetical protein
MMKKQAVELSVEQLASVGKGPGFHTQHRSWGGYGEMSKRAHVELGMVVHTCNPSNQEAERRILSLKIVWLHHEFKASLGCRFQTKT